MPPAVSTLSSDETDAEAAKNGASLGECAAGSEARHGFHDPPAGAPGSGSRAELVLTGSFTEATDTEVAAYVDAQRSAGFNGRENSALRFPRETLAPGAHTLKVRLNYAGGQTKAVGQI